MDKDINSYIRQYGEEEGRKRFDNRGNQINTLGWYINKYGDEEGKIKYDEKNKRVGSKSIGRNTLDGFISRHGEIEGKKLYEEFIYKSKHTLEKYIKKYGKDEGEVKWDKYLKKKKETSKRAIEYWLNVFDGNYTLARISQSAYQSRGEDFYIDKYGEEEGIKKWEDRKTDQSIKISKLMLIKENRDKHKVTKEKYIMKYGEIDGEIEWNNHLKNRKNFGTIKKDYLDRFGDEIGAQKWKEHIYKIISTDLFYSDISQTLFNSIYELIQNKNNIYYGSLNSEYFIYDNENNEMKFYDFFIKDIGIIIEFHGDFWHANPKIYNESYYHPVIKKTAKEIWLKQKEKTNLAESKGYNVIEIWEKDYNDDKIGVVNYCLDIITNKIKQKTNE